MLDISEKRPKKKIEIDGFRVQKELRRNQFRQLPLVLFIALVIVVLVSLFLPWHQNVRAKGYVNTLRPEQRPQAIQSIIDGRIEKWFVREGDFVNAGDTIIYLTEVTSDYFDPDIVQRTARQVDAKNESVDVYGQKIEALQNQYNAIKDNRKFKLDQLENDILQAKNQITIDSIDLVAYKVGQDLAINQWERIKDLQERGLKSLSDLQDKELKKQEMQAKVVAQENKLINTRNKLSNLEIQRSSLARDFDEKLAKVLSEQQTARSERLDNMATTAKLENQLSNINQRQKFYFLRAPQSGYITQTIKKGLGELIKSGSDVATIMPSQYDLAVELYLKPQDVPLLELGQAVRLRFDGWPALVISGWPEASTGVFKGRVFAIDRFIDDRGYYRILISPEETEKNWPVELRVGTGANAFVLLNVVPVWYEIWRQLNGFPPDYYQKDKPRKQIKSAVPIKKLK